MEPAAEGLRTELEQVDFADPSFPVIANASAEPVRDAAAARRLLGEQLTAPVRWVESMQRAAAEAGNDVTFVEVGPGAVLSGLLRRIVRNAQSVALGTADQLNAFMEQHA
jgi:[acyl-carrier-protein] S-malonyltransferase